MLKRNQFLKYRLNSVEGEDGGEGGGGDNGNDNAAALEALRKEFDAVKAKNDELLSEAKKAKQARRDAEDHARTSAEEALKKAGDFESLYKSSLSELEKTKNDFEGLKGNIATEKRNNAAMKLATELAEGPNAELLSEFISKRLRYTDEGVKVTDINGELTVSSLDDLKREFQSSDKFASLLRGNQASGGGAAGGKQGGGAAKEVSREEFAAKSPQDRAKFMKDGGKVTN